MKEYVLKQSNEKGEGDSSSPWLCSRMAFSLLSHHSWGMLCDSNAGTQLVTIYHVTALLAIHICIVGVLF